MGAIERWKDPVYIMEQYVKPQTPLLLLETISCWRAVVSKKPKESYLVVHEKDVKIKGIF